MLSSDCLLSPRSSFHFQGQGLVTDLHQYDLLRLQLWFEWRVWPRAGSVTSGLAPKQLRSEGPGRLAHLGGLLHPVAPFPFPDQPPVAPWAAQARGEKPIPGPDRRLRLALGPAHRGAPGHGRRGLATEGKKAAAAGAADPEAAAFVGRGCVLRARDGGGGVGRKDTARSGSREWGEAGPGRRSGSRWAARVREARDPPPAPSPGHGLRKPHGHSHGCTGLQGPRAVAALGVAWPARAAAAAVAAAGARPSLPPSAPPPRPAGPHLLRSPQLPHP